MIFSTLDNNPITQILACQTPKKQKTNIKCIDDLISTTSFHQFTKDELNSFFNLFSNGQTLEILKNEYNIKSEINISSLLPLIKENIQINDQNIKNITSFYILRCSVTFMSQNITNTLSSSLKKMFQLLLYLISNNSNTTFSNLAKKTFLVLLYTFIDKINSDMLEILQYFFNIEDDYNDESLIVLTTMTKQLLNQVSPDIDSFLLNYSSRFLLKANNLNDVKDTLTNSISPMLQLFDKNAISFVSKCISKFNYHEIKNFLNDVPNHLIKYQNEPFFKIPNLINSDKEIFQCDIEKIHSAQLLPFKKVNSFDPSYEISFTIPRFIIDNYFPKDLINILLDLRMIAQKMQEANKLLSEIFIRLIQEEDRKTKENLNDNKLFDIAIMALYICEDDYLNLIILRSKIFSPNISTYEYKEIKDSSLDERKDYELIFGVRTICINQMRSLFSIIFAFLFSFYQYPLFVGDIFAFLTNESVPNLSEMTKQNQDLLIEQLSQIAGDYQTIQFRKLASQDKISYSRVEILFYILKLLKKEENTQILIRNALFMQLIVSFMCEEKLRPIILQTLEEVCIKHEFDLSDCFSDYVKFIIIHNDDNKLRHDTLMSLNKIISAIPDYKEYFSELVDPLIDSLNSISKSSNETNENGENFSLLYMKNIFKFVSLASIDSSISSTNKILSAIQRIEGDDPSEETFNTLLNTITGNNKKYKFEFNEETKCFKYDIITIKYPSILGVFVKAFQKSSKFIGILQMLKESCSISRQNAIKCHEGQIDLLIIDIIKELIEKNRNESSNNKDEEMVINALQLFSSIAIISSSVIVAQKFFSLFNEIDEHVVSVFQSIFYIIFNDLTQTNNSIDEYLPINSNTPVVQIQGINTININYGFSIYLSIFISNTENSCPKFFSINDDKRNKIELFGESKKIKLRISKNEETIHIINFDHNNFEYNSWNKVVFSFINFNNKFSVSTFISSPNNNQTLIYSFDQMIDLDKNYLSFIFGGSNQSNQKGFDKSAIKFIGIHQLLDEDESSELFKGIFNQTPNKTIGSIEFLSKDNYLIISPNFSQQKITAKLVGPSVFVPTSFKSVLIYNDLMLMIYPLLSQSNFVYIDGRKTPDFDRILFMILFNVLKSSLTAQILFYKSNGIECLAHILTLGNSCSFENYQNVFHLFKQINYMPLKSEIMEKILLNMNIWAKANALSQLQIYRDWSRTLNTKFNDYTNKFMNFHSLIRDLRMFYWFSPVEKNIINANRKEELDSKIVDIRSSILQILHTMSQRPDLFGYDELSLLITHCTSCQDSQQVLSLLSFIRLIIVSPETPLRNIDDLWPQVARLHSLLYTKTATKSKKLQLEVSDSEEGEIDDKESANENIVLAVIDIFVTLHFLKIIEKPKVNTHVSIIIDLIPVESITNHFFVRFFPFAMKYPDVTPLLFFLGMKMSETELNIIVNKLSPDVKFSSMKYWDLYPVLFGLKYGGEKLDFICKFLAFSVHDNWDKVYQTISLIGLLFDLDTDEFKSKFLSLVCSNIMETSSLFHFEYLHNFFDVALLHIFFRKANQMNPNLNSLFMDSPFSSECTEIEEKPTFSSEISKNDFFAKLNENSEKIQNQENDIFQSVFGLRVDKEGKWLDCKLAVQLIQLSLKTKVQTFHNASSLLLAFLLRESPNDPTISQYIQQLISKRVVDKPFLEFLKFIHTKEQPTKGNYFECFEIFVRDRMNINNSLLKGISNFARKMEKLYKKMKDETININKICSNKKLIDDENERIQNHLIQNNSIMKKYKKEYLSNEESVKTATNNKEFLRFKSENFKEIRQNFYNDTDCLVKYREKQIIKDDSNSNNPPVSPRSRMKQSQNRSSTSIHHAVSPQIKKEKSTMFVRTPKKYKVASQFYEEPISIGKLDGSNENTHTNHVQSIAMYYSQKDPMHSIKVMFNVTSSKVVITNKDLSSLSIRLVYKELDAKDIKEMIFMPNKSSPVGIEIVTKSPRKSYYLTLLSGDSLSILKTIASFIEFRTVFIQTQMPKFFFKSLGITKKWKEGRVSNFEYLMKLNRFSGRTFCNIDSYPIFPRLEITNEKGDVELRNLNEPINSSSPVSDSNSIMTLLKNYLPFKSKPKSENESPFTRTPRKIPRRINFITNTNSKSVELTPEYFYDPKYFIRTENDDDEEFRKQFEVVYKRRKLLESSDISGFIDLIWGTKREAFSSGIANLLPMQLFKNNHPTRKSSKSPKTNEESKIKRKKKPFISFHDEAHNPAFVTHELSLITNANDDSEDKSKIGYFYSFVCVDKKSKYIYKVDVDLERKTINSKDTWSKLQGNLFAATKIKPKQRNSLLSLKTIFSTTNLTATAKERLNEADAETETESEIPIDIDKKITSQTAPTSQNSNRKTLDEESRSGELATRAAIPDFQLKIISALPFSSSSALTNTNDSLKTFTYRSAETGVVDSEVAAGISILACDRNIVVTAGKIGSVVSIYRDFAFVKTVPLFRGRVTAIDVSASFGIIAATTADGFLVVMNALGSRPRAIQKSVDLNKIGKKNVTSTNDNTTSSSTNQITENTSTSTNTNTSTSTNINQANSEQEQTENNNTNTNTSANQISSEQEQTENTNINQASSEQEQTDNSNTNTSANQISSEQAQTENSNNDGAEKDKTESKSTSDYAFSSSGHSEFSGSRAFTPKKVLVTKKWGFVAVYSEADDSPSDSGGFPSHHLKRHRSKLTPGSFTALSVFFTHEDTDKTAKPSSVNGHLLSDDDFAVGAIDIFSPSGDFIRRALVDCPITAWTSFSTYDDFDFIAAANEEGEVYVFEAFYATLGEPIAKLKEKEVEFMIVPHPNMCLFAFSSNGDVDVVKIDLQ